jgi:hypothetical protein
MLVYFSGEVVRLNDLVDRGTDTVYMRFDGESEMHEWIPDANGHLTIPILYPTSEAARMAQAERTGTGCAPRVVEVQVYGVNEWGDTCFSCGELEVAFNAVMLMEGTFTRSN